MRLGDLTTKIASVNLRNGEKRMIAFALLMVVALIGGILTILYTGAVIAGVVVAKLK